MTRHQRVIPQTLVGIETYSHSNENDFGATDSAIIADQPSDKIFDGSGSLQEIGACHQSVYQIWHWGRL